MLTDDPFIEVVNALTQVARRRDHRGEPCDFADFLAECSGGHCCQRRRTRGASRRPTRIVGGVVRGVSLLQGTMGDEPGEWQRFRTEPIVVPLNIAELIESGDHHPGLAGLDDVIEAIERSIRVHGS